jgi:endonuclease-3
MDTKRAINQLNELSKLGRPMRLAAEDWKNDYEILISTILSARTRDETTIPVAEKLFEKYKNPQKLAKGKIKNISKIIRPVNFYKTKAKNIIKCSQYLVKNFKGKVPYDFEALLSLPGVGRKTANVFLVEVGKEGLAVDTHVAYCSRKIGWTKNTNPHKIEADLKKLFPKKYWSRINSTLVRFGKTYTSRKQKDKIIENIRKIR